MAFTQEGDIIQIFIMSETDQNSEVLRKYEMALYSADVANGVALTDQCSDLDRVLKLLTMGIEELSNINGINRTAEMLGVVDRSHYDDKWKDVVEKGDELKVPILIVCRNNEGNPIGIMDALKYVFRKRRAVYVSWIVVDPAYRRQNIAKQMYAELEKWSTSQRVELVIAGINDQNLNSQLLHAQLGFHIEPNIEARARKDITEDNTPITPTIRFWVKELAPESVGHV